MKWKWRISVSSLILPFFFALASSSASQDRIAALSAADLARGGKIYNGQCALCHGIGGVGGRGPALNQPKLDRANDDAGLFKVIQNGIEGSEMPVFWMLTEAEIWQVAGYVRSLGRVAPVKLPGDAARGRTLYLGQGNCAACHIVKGEGGVSGPELTEIGLRRSPAHLREAVLDPAKTLPDGYLVVSVTTTDGRQARGERLNEDSFSIQLRDASHRFHSFRKSEIRTLKKEFGVSSMPSYKGAFSAAELDDLVAYLYSLRGQK
ncbi:MAG: c-type cytochrome [Blastocatellia bacterium]|nr:c-type cytochrome [Blastocatellia bacterium]